MTRAELLEAAKKCVCGERERDYGTPENNFNAIASLWGAYLYAANPMLDPDIFLVRPKDVAMMMALLKIARIAAGTETTDSFIDLAGYAACGGEIATNYSREEQ